MPEPTSQSTSNPSDTARTAVIALGGNAITRAGQRGTYPEQFDNARAMAAAIAELVRSHWNIVVVHGNGPQVGSLAAQQDAASQHVPPQPLFSLVAMTQGQLGSLLTLALREQLSATGVVSLVTHAIVHAEDPAFQNPTKPIGQFFTAEQRDRLVASRGWSMVEDAGRGYRRVVASPQPLGVLEADAIGALLAARQLVVAGGGGGVPVVMTPHGYRGIDAVIDKDLGAQRLASTLRVEALALVTGVDSVSVGFATPAQRDLGEITVDEARRYQAEGQFAAGSMGPKVSAAIEFLQEGGGVAVITSPQRLVATLAGERDPSLTGTRIVGAPRPRGPGPPSPQKYAPGP